MSKKSKEVEHLRGIIRNLKKQLARKHKNLHKNSIPEYLDYEDEVIPKNSKLICPKCKADLDAIDLDTKMLFMCTSCNYRCVKHGK